ncbi:MAG: DMT family transporter [Deltaproteobacteria bacterium]|nr:MAG: DMT family transporter [Deltaproteobacteria bacterium]
MPLLGEIAAVATATMWAGSSLAFARATERLGTLVVNLVRLVLALGMLVPTAFVLRGEPWPSAVDGRAWALLSLSGIVGLFAGDLCLFRAFVLLGPRLAQLVMALAPALTALMGWVFLDESLSGRQVFGIAVTLAGILWAASERTATQPLGSVAPRSSAGWLFALGGALGQAGGLVLSKMGMRTVDPLAATEIRTWAAVVGFIGLVSVRLAWPAVRAAMRDRQGLSATAVGAVFGPYLGVFLSMVAVQHTKAGIAASLMALAPVLVIPLVVWRRRERVGPRGWVGAAVAVCGAAILMA